MFLIHGHQPEVTILVLQSLHMCWHVFRHWSWPQTWEEAVFHWCCSVRQYCIYRKIPKISPGAYIFQRSFLGGLISGGKFCVSKSAGLIIGGKFVSAIPPCANDNIGALTRISWQLNFSEHANFKTATTLLKMEVWVQGGGIELPLWTEGSQGESEECTL